jgi:quercetin dioxygenase-like cupin family protein
MTSDTTQAPSATAIHAGEGEALWFFDSLAEIKATAADTGGRMTIVEITEPPNSAAPLHVHHTEDEAFWIVEGDVTFEVGDLTVECHAGDYAFGPRGIPHRYDVGDNGCRMLFILTPGGFESFVREVSRPAQSRTLPEPSEPDMAQVAAAAAAHGCELLG